MNEDLKKEVEHLINLKLIDKAFYDSLNNQLVSSLDKKEIKIEIGSFGCFLLGCVFTLIMLGIWSWF